MTKMIPPELEGEYIIRVVDLPDGSRGFVTYDEDGFANVYINARLSYEGQHKSSDHEMRHLINDDIHNDDDIRVVEARADGLQNPKQDMPILIKAKDLLPTPSKPPKPKVQLTAHQLAVLRKCITELDTFAFDNHNRY